MEAGFIAVNQLDEISAMALFKTAQMLRPDNSLCKLGYGIINLHKLNLKEAISQFNKVLKEDPANDMAKAFLGIAYSLTFTNTEKSEEILRETQASSDPMIQNLSGTALTFIENTIKKAPSPMEVMRQKKRG